MKFKVGDKICYNAFGQRKRTLGMIMDMERVDSVEARWKSVQEYELGQGGIWMIWVQWWKTGNVMPKRWNRPLGGNGLRDMPKCGDIVWHEAGDWFEVVK